MKPVISSEIQNEAAKVMPLGVGFLMCPKGKISVWILVRKEGLLSLTGWLGASCSKFVAVPNTFDGFDIIIP